MKVNSKPIALIIIPLAGICVFAICGDLAGVLWSATGLAAGIVIYVLT